MMKKILVPTDYSDQAQNAINYAIKFAEKFQASLILFHAFHVPVPTMESTIMISLEDIEQENEQRLKKEARELQQANGGKVDIQTECRVGFAEEAIVSTGEEKRTDLIIMGSHGASGVEEVLVGTNTAGVIERTNCPILVVPEGFTFKEPKNIVFAYDFHEISDPKEIKTLKEIATSFKAKINILHIEKPGHKTDVSEAVAGVRIDHLLDGIEHEMFFMENEDVEDAILTFVKEKNADMVVMMPHKHGFFSRLFHTSSTVKISFHTSVPLLCLPDKF